jgi:hypothetical protein
MELELFSFMEGDLVKTYNDNLCYIVTQNYFSCSKKFFISIRSIENGLISFTFAQNLEKLG